jgi:hypothetical protein
MGGASEESSAQGIRGGWGGAHGGDVVMGSYVL